MIQKVERRQRLKLLTRERTGIILKMKSRPNTSLRGRCSSPDELGRSP
jgi:hypothetical protein